MRAGNGYAARSRLMNPLRLLSPLHVSRLPRPIVPIVAIRVTRGSCQDRGFPATACCPASAPELGWTTWGAMLVVCPDVTRTSSFHHSDKVSIRHGFHGKHQLQYTQVTL